MKHGYLIRSKAVVSCQPSVLAYQAFHLSIIVSEQ